MRAGTLRHKLLFQIKTIPEPQDSFGSPIEEWKDDFTVWGSFNPLGSRNFPVAEKRYRSGIDPRRHRIVLNFDSDASPQVLSIFSIQAPLPIEGKKSDLRIEGHEFR